MNPNNFFHLHPPQVHQAPLPMPQQFPVLPGMSISAMMVPYIQTSKTEDILSKGRKLEELDIEMYTKRRETELKLLKKQYDIEFEHFKRVKELELEHQKHIRESAFTLATDLVKMDAQIAGIVLKQMNLVG